MLYPSIQSAYDWIECTLALAFKCCGEELRQFNERSIACIEIERSASNSEHPAVKATLAQLPSEAWRQIVAPFALLNRTPPPATGHLSLSETQSG